MRLRNAASGLCAVLCLLAVSAAFADDKLASAYEPILRGDYDAGKAALEQLRATGPAEQVARVESWLKSYQDLKTSREELRSKTYAWNIEQAKKSLGEADRLASSQDKPELSVADRELAVARKIYLALSFTAQAHYYAPSKDALANEGWIKELREKVMKQAEWWGRTQKWSKATAYYALMERINDKDKEIKDLRERAARHARLEYIYRNAAEVDRRLKGVTPVMFERAMDAVSRMYFKEPDFKKMAHGGLDNLVALSNTTKLYEVSKLLDGIAAQPMRQAFLDKLEDLRKKVDKDKDFGEHDMVRLFSQVQKASKETVSLPEAMLVVEFTDGALGELDQFTSMIWPVDGPDFDKQMMGHFFGVGIQLGVDETTGRLKAVTPLEDSPALAAGIQPDDLIMEVNGESTKSWTTDEAIRRITGEEGTPVTLTMKRPATGETLAFPLFRRNIVIKTVRGVSRVEGDKDGKWDFMLDSSAGIAYIKLSGFTAESADELHKALERAKSQGMKGLILDLRFNPGGLLDVAVRTVSEFQRRGNVVSTKGRGGEESQKLNVDGDADYADLPLVVLVNDSSASASEILSGALQDHSRAAILGERTFGKGSVQKVLNLERPNLFGGNARDLARLKVTTALYYLPNGRSPHKQPDHDSWGVDPDWVIDVSPKEIGKVIERDRRSYIIHNESKPPVKPDPAKAAADTPKVEPTADEDEDPDDVDLLPKEDLVYLRSDPHTAPEIDPQLETALLQMRVKLAGDLPWPRQLAKSSVAKDDKP